MSNVREWYRGLPDQWRAAIRSAYQAVVGTLLAFLLASLSVAVNLVNGGTLSDAITDLSNLARVAVVAIIGVLSGLVSFGMNRPSASGSATYDT